MTALDPPFGKPEERTGSDRSVQPEPHNRPAAPTIPRTPPSEPALDLEALRRAGLEYIQRLAGDIWTDHNAHDPGVTILEALCFSLSDLAYRTTHKMRDLLTPPADEGELRDQFLTARQALTSSPLTEQDYRKLIIDCEGVSNAWIELATESEVSLHRDLKNGHLTAKTGTDGVYDPLELNGLYRVRVVLDQDLRGESVDLDIEGESPGKGLEKPLLQLRATPILAEAVDDESDVQPAGLRSVRSVTIKREARKKQTRKRRFVASALVRSTRNGRDKSIPFVLESRTRDDLLGSHIDLLGMDALEAVLTGEESRRILSLFLSMQEKRRQRMVALEKIRRRLTAHRNLCEDFVDVTTMDPVDVAVCAEITINPETDVDTAHAEILWGLEQLLSSEVPFRSLQELLEADYSPEQIFEGPRLEHGFILAEDLDRTRRPVSKIYGSDVIRILMDVDGIIAVRRLVLTDYVDGAQRADGATWELQISEDTDEKLPARVPRLDVNRSQFIFYRGLVPYTSDPATVRAKLRDLRAVRSRPRFASGSYDLVPAGGTHRALKRHRSVQHHLPAAYGVGEHQTVSDPASPRQARAHELRGYLLIFDQLMADSLAQLAHARDSLSIHAMSQRTRLSQAARTVPGFSDLIAGAPTTDIEQVLEALAEEEPLVAEPSETAPAEGPPANDGRLRRRNAMLDHLLARFAEQFDDYAAITHGTAKGRGYWESVVRDKERFLAAYDEQGLAYGRGRGIVVGAIDSTSSSQNMTGLAKRVSRLLGFSRTSESRTVREIARRFFQIKHDSPLHFRFDLRLGSQTLLTSKRSYRNAGAARSAVDKIILRGLSTNSLVIRPDKRHGHQLHLLDERGRVLTNSFGRFASRDEAAEARDRVITTFAATTRELDNAPAEHDFPVDDYFDRLYGKTKDDWGYRLRTTAGEVKLIDSRRHQTVDPIYRLVEQGALPERYVINAGKDGKFGFKLKDPNGKYVAHGSSRYATKADALQALNLAVKFLLEEFHQEHLYVVEHILLRPQRISVPNECLMTPIKSRCPQADSDPYSFRATVVLPYWPKRFQHRGFRQHVERTLRSEAPAHVALRICWVSMPDMIEFKVAWENWLSVTANPATETAVLHGALRNLVASLEGLRSVYPSATLREFGEPDGGLPVILDNTSLGTNANATE